MHHYLLFFIVIAIKPEKRISTFFLSAQSSLVKNIPFRLLAYENESEKR